MSPSSVPQALRDLADKFEAIGFDESEASCGIELNVHNVSTREGLAQLVSMMNNPAFVSECSAIVGYDWRDNPVRLSAFFTPGLLGGERREVFVDSQSGLDALMAEVQQPEAVA